MACFSKFILLIILMVKDQPKVLITDDVHDVLIKGLSDAGYHCDYQPGISLNEVHGLIHQYQGIVINSKIIVDKNLLEKADNLRFVARLGSGLEIVDLQYCKELNVAVLRSPDGNCDAVAEHALGMLLALIINLKNADSQVRQKIWRREQNRGWELKGKTIGIVGFGYTGRAFAIRLAGFGVKVLAYDKYITGYASDYPYVVETNMEDIFENADILSLHLPSTAETKGLADSKFWSLFKKQIVLINTSRGNIVPVSDLLMALNSGKVSGACLDVFENEKPGTFTVKQNLLFDDLYQRDNVLLTPHIAGWTKESKQRLAKLLLDRIMML
jgi:D-3-phosphoglycerate dehydrogenase / 2-oxoglutarate reductase